MPSAICWAPYSIRVHELLRVPLNRIPQPKVTKMLGKTTFATGVGLTLMVLLIGLSSGIQAQTANCTLTQGFWKNHPEAWPMDTIMVGGVTYSKDDAITVLSTPPRGGDATYILAHQLIAAKLNVLNGADGTSVALAIAEADLWLIMHPLGTGRPKSPDRETGIQLASQLDAFNNGLNGPPHCDVEPTPTPTPEQ